MKTIWKIVDNFLMVQRERIYKIIKTSSKTSKEVNNKLQKENFFHATLLMFDEEKLPTNDIKRAEHFKLGLQGSFKSFSTNWESGKLLKIIVKLFLEDELSRIIYRKKTTKPGSKITKNV